MKTLIIMRHGKAELGSEDKPDFNRNLNKRGEEQVPQMAAVFKAAQRLPETILCSAASRTMQTCDLFVKNSGYAGPVVYSHDMYLARASQLFEIIQAMPESSASVMLVGHNPGVSDICGYLLNESFVDMPTAAIAVISLPVKEWKDLATGIGKLTGFYYPKQALHK